MAGHRDLAKKLLPNRFVDWYRGRRVAILESAGGATKITPKLLAGLVRRKVMPVRGGLRRATVDALPRSWVNGLRARRARRRYLKALGFELLERETRLDYLEGRVAARRDGFYERIVRDVLERTELILQELDRRIEGVSARTGERLNAVEEQLVQLREEIGRLRQLSDPGLRDVGSRARAEVPEVASAEGEDDRDAVATATPAEEPAEAEDAEDAEATEDAEEPQEEAEGQIDASGAEGGPEAGNGRVAAGAPAPVAPRPE